jgi:AraC-like DNA-binding protein
MAPDQFPKIYLYKRIVQAKLFIDAHYVEKIDLDNIAGEAHFSKFHFIRLFKSAYGKTPHHYLTQVRIDHAQVLLANGSSIMDAAFAVGFDSITSFTGLFKRIVRMPPSVFQQRQRARQAALSASPLTFIPNCFAETHGWIRK